MSVLRVKELTNIDNEQQSSVSTTKMMPREQARAGEALVPLLHASPPLNSSLAPLDSRALVHSGWPWQGNIRFSNVSMRYSPSSPLVLEGVTLAVPAGTTLGVVGRTGSGKR
jgi:ABC-type multidrug transport system fused ATPase/permease subunit